MEPKRLKKPVVKKRSRAGAGNENRSGATSMAKKKVKVLKKEIKSRKKRIATQQSKLKKARKALKKAA